MALVPYLVRHRFPGPCLASVSVPRQIPRSPWWASGWWFFGRSMAEKSVTLVTVASSSGEPQPIPRGRRAAAQLGMLTFAHRRGHAAVAPRHRGHRLLVDHRRRHVAELPRAPALPLRSLVREAAASAHADARHGRHQPAC